MNRRTFLALSGAVGGGVILRADKLKDPDFLRSTLRYPLDLGITFNAAWGMVPLSKAATNLCRLRRTSDNAEQDIVRRGKFQDYPSIESFLAGTTGRVTTLYDQTGNGWDATQPTAGSQAQVTAMLDRFCCHCNQAGGIFNISSGLQIVGEDASVYFVWIANDRTFSACSQIPPMIPTFAFKTGASYAALYAAGGTRTDAESLSVAWDSFPDAPKPLLSGNCSINVGRVRFSSTKTEFMVNEVIANVASSSGASTRDGFQIMSGHYNTTLGCALLGFLIGPKHTDAQEQTVLENLKNLFGTETKSKLIAFDGDSVTAGYQNGILYGDFRELSWPYKTLKSIGDKRILGSNRAISSSQIVDGTGNPDKDLSVWAPKKLDAHLTAASYSKKVLVVMAGLNDIDVINAAGSGLTTYNRLVTYCQARKAAGWSKIIVCTIEPYKAWTSGGQNDNERLDYNSRIAGNGLTDWDAVVDVAALTWNPGGSSDWTTNYQGTDGLHPNDAGTTLIANAVKPVLQGFL